MEKTETTTPVTGVVSKKEFQNKAIAYFEKNKNCKKLHITADGQMFENKYFSIQHSITLDSKEIESFENTREAPKVETPEAPKVETPEVLKVNTTKVDKSISGPAATQKDK
ncbi:hypothetical protein FIA58_013845 [Flavobacterium jejuense]|uniref:Uncharacterized protein n=1 Tax=Flavobacterium jejuense TaxID=1544455 RepID=A0ABX0ITE0_9FLAO|nr:hypothetical protein [Flavobacterium jejuense]NHN26763.1 hypothetical protein [Flavobacterium jejuense]